ncbi:hypothetical protein EE612_054317, partial [Oryza sativa]
FLCFVSAAAHASPAAEPRARPTNSIGKLKQIYME